jgi:p24 family protein beta-1
MLPCLFILTVLASVSAHLIEVTAGKKECFFEDLHINDKLTVTYQVAEGGYLDIDFWVSISFFIQCLTIAFP